LWCTAQSKNLQDYLQQNLLAPVGRKRFLKYTALSGAAVLIGLESCRKTTPVGGKHTIDVGSGDTGILNFAYALEQLEAAFYIKVNASFYKNITDAEKQVLTDIMYHEVAHRDFFKKALSSAAIQDLKTDFSDVDFTSRASVLAPTTGLDFSRTPNSTTGGPSIVATANMFLLTKISANQLP
jgi:hypothetical protein